MSRHFYLRDAVEFEAKPRSNDCNRLKECVFRRHVDLQVALCWSYPATNAVREREIVLCCLLIKIESALFLSLVCPNSTHTADCTMDPEDVEFFMAGELSSEGQAAFMTAQEAPNSDQPSFRSRSSNRRARDSQGQIQANPSSQPEYCSYPPPQQMPDYSQINPQYGRQYWYGPDMNGQVQFAHPAQAGIFPQSGYEQMLVQPYGNLVWF